MTRSPAIPQLGAAITLVAAALIAAALLAAFAPSASARSSAHGASFAARCSFDHRSNDDPIVHPGMPGMAHSHDFFGNRSTDAFSTYESLLTTDLDPPTSCIAPGDMPQADKAAYWFPTVSWNGQVLDAYRAVFYYRAGGKDYRKVKPYPPGLKVIAASSRRISWSCGQKDTANGSRTPPSHCDTGTLGVRIIFPDCSNGKTDSADHKSHMAYSRPIEGKRRCPRSHRLPVPQLTINANFAIGPDQGKVTLSCDEGACGPSTMHADFFNAWEPETLESLVVNCINKVPPSKPRPEGCQAPQPP